MKEQYMLLYNNARLHRNQIRHFRSNTADAKKNSLYMYVHANVLSNCVHSGIKTNGNASTLYYWGQALP